MKKTFNVGAQGDTFIFASDASVEGLTPISAKNGYVTIIEGEAHNHAHVFKDLDAVQAYEDTNYKNAGIRRVVLKVVKPTTYEQINTKTGMGYVSIEQYKEMKAANDPRLKDVEDLHAPLQLQPGTYTLKTQRTAGGIGKLPGTLSDLEFLIRPVVD